MMKRLVLAGALTPLLVLAVAAPSGATPASPDRSSPAGTSRLQTAAQADEQDAAAAAALYGIPLAQARQRLAFEKRVSRYVDALPSGVLRDSFAGSVLGKPTHTPAAVLHFKGQVPAGLPQPPTGVALRGGQKHSAVDLGERQAAVHDAAVQAGYGQVTAASDVHPQRITVEVAQPKSADVPRGGQLKTLLRAAGGGAHVHVVEHTDGRELVTPEHGYGGAGFRAGTSRICTSAFAVRRNSDAVEGVLTASHCEGLNTLETNGVGDTVTETFSAPFVAEHIGTNGDIEWHTTTHDEFPEFWATHSERRTVTARATSFSVGTTACHYGRFSGYSCGTISHLSRSGTFTWGGCGCSRTAYNMIATTGATSTGGDSGGPWFLGTTAYGIHHGVLNSTGERLFTPVGRAETQFGVSVELG